MECWHCQRPAAACCTFCGRAICQDHAQKHPSIISVYGGTAEPKRAIVVPDAIWCGICHPREDPLELKSLQ